MGKKPSARFNLYRIGRAGREWRVALTVRALREANLAAAPLAFHEIERLMLTDDDQAQAGNAAE